MRFTKILRKMTDSFFINQISSSKCFDGFQRVYKHSSSLLKCDMNFAVYLPNAHETTKLPVLIWLSGLTCSEQNFITKSGYQKYASEMGIIVVAPDTSPRGLNIDGIRDSWDFGEGASYYVDAEVDKWKENFQMFSYINNELYQVINKNFNCTGQFSIFGHSMGGHGALISFLKNPDKYQRVSAFAPIANASQSAWGKKAFTNFFGENNQDKWKEFDATELALSYNKRKCKILIDQGTEDGFYYKDKQLLPENFMNVCKQKSELIDLELNFRNGYDHSYYFIASFIENHFKFHSEGFKN